MQKEMGELENKLKCPYCGYEWTPRVKGPKECPKCKRYL